MKRSRTSTAALCVALLLTAVTTGAAVASGPHDGTPQGPPPREAAALTGSAKLYRSAGDDITFTFDAHLAAEHDDNPLEATGTFEFSHYLDGGGARAKATVDCLLTGCDVAGVSGVITDSDLPGVEGRAGRRHGPRPRPPRPARLQLGGDGQPRGGRGTARVRQVGALREGEEGQRRLHGRALAAAAVARAAVARASAVSRYGTAARANAVPCPVAVDATA